MSLTLHLMATRRTSVFSRNITHNLNRMAAAAGVYECLWHPDEHGFRFARDIIPVLDGGIQKLLSDPDHFRQFNSENGWGTYEGLLSFCRDVLRECQENPDAELEATR